MPIVSVEWLEGRDRETRERVAAAIERIMQEEARCQPGSTYIVFTDVKRDHFAVGGRLMDE